MFYPPSLIFYLNNFCQFLQVDLRQYENIVFFGVESMVRRMMIVLL